MEVIKMSRRRYKRTNPKPSYQQVERGKFNIPDPKESISVVDGFTNEMLSLGLGTNNMFSDTQYTKTNMLSWDRETLDAAYRQNWIVGKVVDIVAEDATREWINITGDYTPEQVEQIEKEAERLKIRDSIRSAIKWGRLYGGAASILLIEGESLSSPLVLDYVRPNSFKGLYVLDRWTLWPSINTPINEPGPDFGYPKYYRIGTGYTGSSELLDRTVVHHSRLNRFIGLELPYWQRFQDMWWGESVVERMYDRLCAFDNVTFSLVNLVFKAQLRIFKLKDYRKLIAKGGEGLKILKAFMEECRQYQNTDGITMMDEEDSFLTFNPTYSGLNDIMLICGEQLGGAVDIPYVVLFGRGQASIFAGSDQDIRDYYTKIVTFQESTLRSAIDITYKVMIKSMGLDPNAFEFEFRTLWKATPPEAAKMAAQDAASVVTAFDAGLIDRSTALAELRQSSLYHNRWTTIDVNMIKEAYDKPLPRTERMSGGPAELKRDIEVAEIKDVLDNLVQSLAISPQTAKQVISAVNPEDKDKDKQSGKPLPNRGGPKSEGYTPTAESHRSSSNPEGRKTSVSKQKLGAPRIRL